MRANAGKEGIDGQSIEDFEGNLRGNLYKVWNRMSSGCYFPQNVKRVDIPKDGGVRTLGIPTVSDRVAQMVVKMELEPALEAIFDKDSYGYRPCRGAHDALAITRQRCWKQDWVIDLDIKGFFDNLDWALLGKALHKHTNNPWVLLYIDRWLKVPMETKDGDTTERTKGTPQGGVISPLLANLFLHYAFDAWMRREYPDVMFARYADDIVIHCESYREAVSIKQVIEERMTACSLTCHPEKTKVVYCHDVDRRQNYPVTSFDFLGYCFRPRRVRSHNGRMFYSFTPAISTKARQRIREHIKSLDIHTRSGDEIIELASRLNSKLTGWIAYYGRFHKTELMKTLAYLNKKLIKWARKKYKRFKGSARRAGQWLKSVYRSQPYLFAHWAQGWTP